MLTDCRFCTIFPESFGERPGRFSYDLPAEDIAYGILNYGVFPCLRSRAFSWLKSWKPRHTATLLERAVGDQVIQPPEIDRRQLRSPRSS